MSISLVSSVEGETELIILNSEMMAVVRAIRSGTAPRLGDSLDYFIEVPAALERRAFARPQKKAPKPYRFKIEQWHLDAARGIVNSTTDSAAAELTEKGSTPSRKP